MEIDRRLTIIKKVPLESIDAIPSLTQDQITKGNEIEVAIQQLPMPKKAASFARREHLIATQDLMIAGINSEIDSIDNDFRSALEVGANPDEAEVRKRTQTDHLCLGILLARKDHPAYFPGVAVRMYTYPTDGGVKSPTARNRLEIIVPNPSNENEPRTLSTKLSNIANAMRAASNNPGYSSLDFFQQVLKNQKKELKDESEDEFIERRFLELWKLRGLMRYEEFTPEEDLRNKILRSSLTAHLLKIWIQRRFSPEPYPTSLRIGFIPGSPDRKDLMEVEVASSRTIQAIRMPTVQNWYGTDVKTQILNLMIANGVNAPEDYDYIE